jgi:hypothetical protein
LPLIGHSMQRCTRVENPGEGVAQIFVWGGSRLSGKIAKVGPLLWLLLHFYYQVFYKFACGVLFHPPSPFPPHPPPPPVCIYDSLGRHYSRMHIWATYHCRNTCRKWYVFIIHYMLQHYEYFVFRTESYCSVAGKCYQNAVHSLSSSSKIQLFKKPLSLMLTVV